MGVCVVVVVLEVEVVENCDSVTDGDEVIEIVCVMDLERDVEPVIKDESVPV